MNRLQTKPIAVDLVDPLGEFFRRERPLLPGAVGKAECDVVAEPVVFEQQLEPRRMRRAIDEIGAAVAQHLIGPFGEDGVVPHVGHEMGQIVVVNQFGVPEDARFLAEKALDQFAVLLDLGTEFLSRIEKCQRVVIGFGKKLDAAGGVEFLKGLDDLRRILRELFDGDSGQRVAHAEAALVGLDRIEHDAVGRQVAALSDFSADFGVFQVVEVMPIGIEDAVAAKPQRLMNLKIKANGGHTRPRSRRTGGIVRAAGRESTP